MITIQKMIKLLKNKEINQEIQKELDEKLKLFHKKIDYLKFLRDNFCRIGKPGTPMYFEYPTAINFIPEKEKTNKFIAFKYYSSLLMESNFYEGIYIIRFLLKKGADKEILKVANILSDELRSLELEIKELKEVLE